MNYEQARQRVDGKWAWTNMNDGVISTAGGCVTWPEGPPRTIEDAIGPNRKPMGEPHAHDTREDAERCYWEHERDRLEVVEREPRHGNQIDLCEMPHCDELASRAVFQPGFGHRWNACAEHAGAPIYEALRPFAPGLSVVHS